MLTLMGGWMLKMSWHKWVNLSLNYGREVYTPWRITCGQVLYKDIASLFGPLPPYLNALIFKICGVSIMALAGFNIFLIGLVTAVIYKFLLDNVGRRSALWSSIFFLCLLVLRQNKGEQGLFGCICPYSYSVTYALFLGLGALGAFSCYVRSGRNGRLGLLGVLMGLAALCRFEIFLFLAAALALGLIFKTWLQGPDWPLILKKAAWLLTGIFLPVGAAYFYFSSQLPHAAVWESILGFNHRWQNILRLPYYQYVLGTDRPLENAWMLATSTCGYGLACLGVTVLGIGAETLQKKSRRLRGVLLVLAGAAVLMLICSWILGGHERDIWRGLPLLDLFMTGYCSWMIWDKRHDATSTKALWPLWLLGVWGLLMMSKIFLNVHPDSEGFFYALPSVIVMIVFFQDILPRHLSMAGPARLVITAAISFLFLLILAVDLKSSMDVYAARQFKVHSGPDEIIADADFHPETVFIADFLQKAGRVLGPNANFTAFPDGAMLNFLTRRLNPLPFTVFKPTEMIRYGESRILTSFQNHRPDFIVLSNDGWRPVVYPGTRGPSFDHYPVTIRAWIMAHYHPVWSSRPPGRGMITVLKIN